MKLFLGLFSTLCALASADVQFINPRNFVINVPPSKYPSYSVGSTLKIRWTPLPSGTHISLSLWQLDQTKFILPAEQLTRTSTPLTSKLLCSKLINYLASLDSLVNTASFDWVAYDWTVQTTKDLKVSRTFFLSLSIDGNATATADSEVSITSQSQD